MCDLTLFWSLAQAEAPQQPGALESFLPLGLMMLAFWFLFIQPQMKRQKAHRKLVEGLKSGDKVVTNGGMYGTITNVRDDRFVLQIAENTRIEILRSAIQSIDSGTSGESVQSNKN